MDPATHSQCEMIVWRDGERRCELWMVQGVSYLRVFEGYVLVLEELAPRMGALARADTLRHARREQTSSGPL